MNGLTNQLAGDGMGHQAYRNGYPAYTIQLSERREDNRRAWEPAKTR